MAERGSRPSVYSCRCESIQSQCGDKVSRGARQLSEGRRLLVVRFLVSKPSVLQLVAISADRRDNWQHDRTQRRSKLSNVLEHEMILALYQKRNLRGKDSRKFGLNVRSGKGWKKEFFRKAANGGRLHVTYLHFITLESSIIPHASIHHVHKYPCDAHPQQQSTGRAHHRSSHQYHEG